MADFKILFSKAHLPMANYTWSKLNSFQTWIVKLLFQALAGARVRSSSVPATRPRPSAWLLPSSTRAWSFPTGRSAERRRSPARGILLGGPQQAQKQAQGAPAPRRAARRKEPCGAGSEEPREGCSITGGTPELWDIRADKHPPPWAWEGAGQQPGTEYLTSLSPTRCLDSPAHKRHNHRLGLGVRLY